MLAALEESEVEWRSIERIRVNDESDLPVAGVKIYSSPGCDLSEKMRVGVYRDRDWSDSLSSAEFWIAVASASLISM